MTRCLMLAVGGIGVILVVQIRVDQLKAAGHLAQSADVPEIAWSAFLAPLAQNRLGGPF
jgi:hypothetical protein